MIAEAEENVIRGALACNIVVRARQKKIALTEFASPTGCATRAARKKTRAEARVSRH
jgi:hypothetical protein